MAGTTHHPWVADMQGGGEHRQALSPRLPEHHIAGFLPADKHQVMCGGSLGMVAIKLELWPGQRALDEARVATDPCAARQCWPRQVRDKRGGGVEGAKLEPGIERHYVTAR